MENLAVAVRRCILDNAHVGGVVTLYNALAMASVFMDTLDGPCRAEVYKALRWQIRIALLRISCEMCQMTKTTSSHGTSSSSSSSPASSAPSPLPGAADSNNLNANRTAERAKLLELIRATRTDYGDCGGGINDDSSTSIIDVIITRRGDIPAEFQGVVGESVLTAIASEIARLSWQEFDQSLIDGSNNAILMYYAAGLVRRML
jgi:hypothetical protein